MRDRNVVALEVVVDVNLPVAVQHVVAPLHAAKACKLESARLRRNRPENGRKRLRFQIKIDENELFPRLQPQRHHTHGAAVEELHDLHIGRANQPTIERVRPAVIAATENIFAAATLRDGPSAVAADVAEGSQRPFLVAPDQSRLAGHLRGKKRFRVGEGALHAVYFAASLAQRSNKLPGTAKNMFFLNLQNRGVNVKA